MVARDPTYCPQCGAELGARVVHGRTRAWCPDCERPVFRNAVPSAGVVVRDGREVVLIERATDRVGTWAFPGGHPEYDEEPAVAACRELEEETGLRADPADCELFAAVHGEHRGRHYAMVTYELDYADAAGAFNPGPEARDVAFWSVAEVLDSPAETREIDRRRLRMLFEE